MQFSIIIATYDRWDSLERLLTGLAVNFARSGIEHEFIVANNARELESINRIDSIIGKFIGAHGNRFRSVRESSPGKCRAQNRAISEARGAILGFFDDDVEVAADWLEVAGKFFTAKPDYHVMQGPILMPLEVRSDEAFLRAHRRFRTINFVQYPADIGDLKTLTGANMAIRREVFDRVGLFNEELGPGKSGISEDVEFALRVVRSGLRIGYEHDAGVYHEVDWNRLSEGFFRQRHEQQGRSRLIYKKQSLASIVPNLMRSLGTLGWYSLFDNEREKYRAKGRYFHYRAMFIEKTRRNTGSQD